MNKENFFIEQFKSHHIGDDGAFIDGFVYAQDSFFEDIHFRRSWMSLEAIATKSLLVNLSDAIVMNAQPLYILISCAIPKSFTPNALKALAKGFDTCAKKYGVEIIGGDTIRGEKLHITITTISKTKKPIFRKSIVKGDLLAYTGDIGRVAKSLRLALRYGTINRQSKLITPRLRDHFFYDASPYIRSALDISDGLGVELERLSKMNNIGFKMWRHIPQCQLSSGEEYEILFAFDPKKISAIKAIAKKNRTPLTIFAKAVSGQYRCHIKSHHF